MEPELPLELIAQYLSPKIASELNKKTRKLSYVEHVKDLIREDLIMETYLESYLEKSRKGRIAYLIPQTDTELGDDTVHRDKLFSNTTTKEYIKFRKTTDYDTNEITFNVEFGYDFPRIEEAIKYRDHIYLDSISTYNIYMNDVLYKEMRKEDNALYTLAVKELVVEELEDFLPELEDLTKFDVFDAAICYTWFYFNCNICGIEVKYDYDLIQHLFDNIETEYDETFLDKIRMLEKDITSMFKELEKLIMQLK